MAKHEKNPAAVALGKLGGKKGGKARAAALSPERRREIARKAAQTRWAAEKARRAANKADAVDQPQPEDDPRKNEASPATPSGPDLAELTATVRTFCEARDWDQFHGPKDLAIGLVTEAAELLEIFRFLSDAECEAKLNDPRYRRDIENELADVLFFLLRFAQRFDIDLPEAFAAKMKLNAKRYPVDKSRGKNLKYTGL